MTQSLYDAAVKVLRHFEGSQPPERARVLERLRMAVERAAPPAMPAENPYQAARLIEGG